MEAAGKIKQEGFSITELLVVMTLLLLLGSIGAFLVVPALKVWRLNSDARGIATMLQFAKMKAASQFTSHQIVFDTVNNQFKLQRQSGGIWVDGGNAVGLSKGINYQLSVSSPPLIDSPSTYAPRTCASVITFNSHGLPINTTGNSAVYLTEGKLIYGVIVTLAGNVQVWGYFPAGWGSQ